jgi:hypothetical protein
MFKSKVEIEKCGCVEVTPQPHGDVKVGWLFQTLTVGHTHAETISLQTCFFSLAFSIYNRNIQNAEVLK